MKRTIFGIFVIVALVQLAVPVRLVWEYESTLRLGRAYKFHTAPVDPYDAFRGRYVALRFEQTTAPVAAQQPVVRGQRLYALLTEDQQGFAHISAVTGTPPDREDYLRIEALAVDNTAHTVTLAWPFERFYMEETIAPQAEQAYRDNNRRGQRLASVVVRVRYGYGVIENLYIGETPIAAFVRQGSLQR